MADHCRRTYAKNTTCIPDTRTIHYHIHYALVSTGFIGVIDKLKLETLFAVMTEKALYARRRFPVFHNTICGTAVNARDLNDCHKKIDRISAVRLMEYM